MAFTDHKIMEFTHRVVDLPDEPTLSPQELKQRFDSSPEELRAAHNAVCDEGERLSARVEGIVVDTFGDTIDREMLSDELRAELDGKAEEAAVAALDTRVTANEALAAQKCEAYFGTYTADKQASQFIPLGFTPKAVLVLPTNGYFTGPYAIHSAFALQGMPSADGTDMQLAIENGGFRVYSNMNISKSILLNYEGKRFYIAFR